MFYLRMFVSMNAYPDISEKTFNEMGAYEGLSPTIDHNNNYGGNDYPEESNNNHQIA